VFIDLMKQRSSAIDAGVEAGNRKPMRRFGGRDGRNLVISASTGLAFCPTAHRAEAFSLLNLGEGFSFPCHSFSFGL